MLENVPRKQKQFCNFTVNSLRLRGPHGEKVKVEIWALLTKVRDEEKKRREENDKIVEQKKPTPQKVVDVSDSSTESESSTDLPSEKAVTKAMKKVLKKSSNRQLKFKSLRKQVQESLSFKADKDAKKEWKKLMQQCVDSNPNKMVMDGKTVTLTK